MNINYLSSEEMCYKVDARIKQIVCCIKMWGRTEMLATTMSDAEHDMTQNICM